MSEVENKSATAHELLARLASNSRGRQAFEHSKKLSALSRQLRVQATERGVSIRELAGRMNTSKSQVQRLLSGTSPANVTVKTLLKAAHALGLELDIRLRDRPGGTVYRMSGAQDGFVTLRVVEKSTSDERFNREVRAANTPLDFSPKARCG